MDEEDKMNRMMKMEVRGSRAKGMRWMDNIRRVVNKCGPEEGDSQDRRR